MDTPNDIHRTYKNSCHLHSGFYRTLFISDEQRQLRSSYYANNLRSTRTTCRTHVNRRNQSLAKCKTTFTFPNKFTANTRNVTLDGEGYFNVTRDTEKPFLVQTEKYNIKVLGTEFNVTAYSGSPVFETALLKGAVEVSSPATYSKVYLKPNTRTYERNGELRTGIIEHQSYFLWKEGLICFFDEPVGKMIEKLELYYDVKIDVRNTELLKNRYSGKFRTKDGVEHVLKVLQLRHRFTYTKDNDLNLITIK